MKKPLIKSFIVLLAACISLSSCKKKSDPAPPSDDTSQQTADVSDESGITYEADASLNDANTALSTGSTSGERIAAGSLIKGATVDTSQLSTMHKLVINYDGSTTVSKRVRAGSLTVQLIHGSHWKDAGAVVTLTYNYEVTWSNGKSWSLSGTKTITNVTGGLIKDLSGAKTITHKVRGAIDIVFEDNTSRTWYFARQRTFSLLSGTPIVTVNGDTTVNGIPNIDKGGVNRRGINFYVEITTPLVWNTGCDLFTSGVKVHKGVEKEVTVTYGVDANGAAVGSCNASGYKLDWTNASGVAKEVIVSY